MRISLASVYRAFIYLTTLFIACSACLGAKTSLDKNGNILLEGKEFFPIGLYVSKGAELDQNTLADFANVGFNCIVFDRKPDREILNHAERFGLPVLELPNGIPIKHVSSVADIDVLPADKRPKPKLFVLTTSDEMLENAAARAVIDCAKGILYPIHHLPKAETLANVNAKLKIMSKVALAPWPVEHSFPEDRMKVIYKEIDGRGYIITANLTDQPQSLFIYLPDPVQPVTSDIGRDREILAKEMYFWCGFEKYAIKMFNWELKPEF